MRQQRLLGRNLHRLVHQPRILNRLTAALVALAIISAGCTTETGSEQVAFDERDLFPEEIREDLRNLQQAIDMRLADDIAACLAEQGWKYIEPPAPAVPDRHPGPVAEALAMLEPPPPATAEYLASLSANERAAYEERFGDCVTSSEWNVSHPLVAEGNLLDRLADEASSRAAASPDFLSAELTFQQCVAERGLGDFDAIRENIAGQTSEIVDKLRLGQATPDQTRADLQTLDDEWQQHASRIADCEDARTLQRRMIYGQELRQVALDHPELPFLVAEVRDQLDLYEPELAELRTTS